MEKVRWKDTLSVPASHSSGLNVHSTQRLLKTHFCCFWVLWNSHNPAFASGHVSWNYVWHKADIYICFLLFKYKSHSIQFTNLKCIIQWLLGYSQDCVTPTIINFRTCSSPQKAGLIEVFKKKNIPQKPFLIGSGVFCNMFFKLFCYNFSTSNTLIEKSEFT